MTSGIPKRAWAGGLLAVLCAALAPACKNDPKRHGFNQPVIGAPQLRHPVAATAEDAGPPRVIEERLPDEAARTFKTLAEMERSPRWAAFADVIRAQVRETYAKDHGGRPHKQPHDIAITQYFIRELPEVYGLDYVVWCGASYGGGLSYVEHHLLLERSEEKLIVLSAHRPRCGAVGDRSVFFVDLIADGRDELIEVYVEDNPVGDDSQEIRAFRLRGKHLERIAQIRHSSPVKFFHHEFRRGRGHERDIVTTHIEIKKARARLRGRPCWVYRYFEVETTHRYKADTDEFVTIGTSRRRVPQNVALDVSGGEAPEGSCGG